MPTTHRTRSSLMFWLALLLAVYVVVSAGIAVSTADECDGGLDGSKTWQPLPPHWECSGR